MAVELFLDASYAIALASSTDQHHESAVELAQRIEAEDRRLIISCAVVLEIGNALSKLRYRAAAIALLDAIERDPNVEIVPLSEELYRRSLELYRQHQDKEWGLTDCVSFAVMWERSITDALTADDHFRQAGFRALLGER
ncbi:MAG: PIN domain-containing protein [Actinobacteria bacterium]|nr:PIN domain-containing protein [Actinomycetota bacterium]